MPSKFHRRAILLLAAAVFTGVLAIRTGPAAAASSQEVSVSPFLQEVRIDSSEATKNFNVAYTNDSSKSRKLVLSVVDFGSLDQTGGVAFAGSGLSQLFDKYTLSHWLMLPDKEIVLAPGQKATVTPVISNDASLGPGGHYAAVVATVVDPDSTGSNSVSVKQKISSLILAVKTGGEKYDLKLEKISSNGGPFRLPSEAYLTIRATGNVHVVPRGVVYLTDKTGKRIAKGVINQESGYVLPDTAQVFTVELNRLASPNFWETSFSLQADYRYDGLDMYASKKTSLRYVNPFLILAVLAIAALAFGLWHFRTGVKRTLVSRRKKQG